MPEQSQNESAVLRFSLKPVGPPRSEEQIKNDVKAALEEALKRLGEEQKNVSAEAEPEGAFLGVAIATIWLLKTIGTGLVSGGAAAAGKRLFDYFADSLRSRNLDPGSPAAAGGSKDQNNEGPAIDPKGDKKD